MLAVELADGFAINFGFRQIADYEIEAIEIVSTKLTSRTGWYGRSSADADRIPSGPKRAPVRKVVAVSNGIPTTAASTPASSTTWGSRMNVLMPEKRG